MRVKVPVDKSTGVISAPARKVCGVGDRELIEPDFLIHISVGRRRRIRTVKTRRRHWRVGTEYDRVSPIAAHQSRFQAKSLAGVLLTSI